MRSAQGQPLPLRCVVSIPKPFSTVCGRLSRNMFWPPWVGVLCTHARKGFDADVSAFPSNASRHADCSMLPFVALSEIGISVYLRGRDLEGWHGIPEDSPEKGPLGRLAVRGRRRRHDRRLMMCVQGKSATQGRRLPARSLPQRRNGKSGGRTRPASGGLGHRIGTWVAISPRGATSPRREDAGPGRARDARARSADVGRS